MSIFIIFVHLMRRKQTQPIQDPNQLNAAFLLKFAKLNYEAKNINFEMLNAFSNFLQHVGDSLSRQPQKYTQQIIRALIDIAITVQFNLHMTEDFVSFQIEAILKFMQSLFNFADKVFTYEQASNHEKVLQIIDVFWPLLNNEQQINKVQVKQFQKITIVLQKISNLPYIYQIQSYPLNIDPEAIIEQAVQISYLKQKIDFSVLFKAALLKYNQKNRLFFKSFSIFFQHLLNQKTTCKQSRSVFQKCLNFCSNLTNSSLQRQNSIKTLSTGIIKSTNFIRNFVYAFTPRSNDKPSGLEVNIQQNYSSNNLLSLSLMVLQKIINSRYMNQQMADALGIIYELSQNWPDLQPEALKLSQFNQNKDFINKSLAFLMMTKNRTQIQISTLTQIFQAASLQNQNDFYQTEEIDQKRLFQYIKQYKMRSQSQDGQQDLEKNKNLIKKDQKQKNGLHMNIIKIFSKILQNMSLNKQIANKIKFNSIQELQKILFDCFEGQSQNIIKQTKIIQQVNKLIVQCFPNLISDSWIQGLIEKYILKEKTQIQSQQSKKVIKQTTLEIIYVLIIKKIEKTQFFSKLKQDIPFDKFINKVFELSQSQNIKNFHFFIFYMYFKKCSSLSQNEQSAQIHQITSIIIQRLGKLISSFSQAIQTQDANTEAKTKEVQQIKKKLTILQFCLILILDHPSGSFKLHLKKLFSNDIFNINRDLDIHELISINQKQNANNFFGPKIKSILQENSSQISQSSKFLKYVQNSNSLIFQPNYLKTSEDSKQEKNLKIFINIKMNYIALSINKLHKMPNLIKDINMMRKINSMNSFEILLFSFYQYFKEIVDEKKNIQVQGEQVGVKTNKLQESLLIVAFNYLLKINIEAGKFDQKCIEQVQNDVKGQIIILRQIHISVQQALLTAQKLIMLSNPPFQIRNLIKVLKNIKESVNRPGIAQKYTQILNQGQIIKFISELTYNQETLNMQFTQLGLITMKKIILKDHKILQRIQQLQKIKLQQKQPKIDIQFQNQQIIMEQNDLNSTQMTDLPLKLRQFYLLYYPHKHQLNLSTLLRVKIQTQILQLLEDPVQLRKIDKDQLVTLYRAILDHLMANIPILRQITLKQSQVTQQHTLDLLWNLQCKVKSKFITYIINSILRTSSSTQNQTVFSFEQRNKIFSISSELFDNQQICKLAQDEVGNEINQKFSKMISQRTDQGIRIVMESSKQSPVNPKKSKKRDNQNTSPVNKQIEGFLLTNKKLYHVLKKIINPDQVKGQQIISTLIQKDNLDSLEITEFLIQQLTNLAEFIKAKSQSLTQTIFNYIMKVNQSYKTGKQLLKLPQFLCQFFNISNCSSGSKQISNIQRNQRQSTVCSNNPCYRCLKCDQKRFICYGCMMQCHKGHPVVYVSENKYPRCQCRQLNDDKCKLSKRVETNHKQVKNPTINNIFSYERRTMGRPTRHQFYMGEQDRMDLPLHIYDDQQYFREPNRFGETRIRKTRQLQSFQKQAIFGIDPSFERVQNPFAPQLVRQQKKVEQKLTEQNFDFQDQKYEANTPMQVQKSNNQSPPSQIASQSYLLPVFLQMFNDTYTGSQEVSVNKIYSQHEKFSFDSLLAAKVMHSTWKATNAGTYNVKIRKQNILNNKSPAVSKQVIAQNHKFIVIASGTMLSVHLKERFFLQLLQGKPSATFPNIHQHSITFDIHTIDFSPLDDNCFCVAGLHMIILFTLNAEGVIARTNSRVNVNNDYINKVRTSNLGVFYSTSYQIKLLNWAFKQLLTIKSSSDCLLKEWCLYEKNQSCTVYCVTSQGYTQFIDVSPSDEGKKVFAKKVMDGRKSIQTGASILVKDVYKIGKIYLGSFKDKDGTNMIANLEGDTTQNTSFFSLRNNYLDILGKNYLLGQTDIIKGSQNEVFIVCTIRQALTPEISIHQGQLAVFRIRKDKKCEFSLVNKDIKCQFFSVINVGEHNWAVISMHNDGSLQFSVFQNPQKQAIEAQCKKLKQYQPVSNEKNIQKYTLIKQSIRKNINPQLLSAVELQPIHFFRQFSDLLKTNNEYKMKKKDQEYQITLLSSNKVITGFSLPFFGNVYFPHRTVKNCVQIGLSNLQILHCFSQGTLKFRVEKIQELKMGRQSLNQKFLQKYQRLQRFHQLSLDSERATQLLNSIKQIQALSDQVLFYGQSMDTFKSRVPNFAQIFTQDDSSSSRNRHVQKMAIILKIFIQDSISKQNYLCEPYQIIEFVKNLRKTSLVVPSQTYGIVKDLIFSALKMHENITQIKTHVFNDQFYPLKYATEDKAQFYYQLVKTDINESFVEQIVQFFIRICDQDLPLCLLYLSKYPLLIAKIQKKSKKIEKLQMNRKLLKLYIITYQVLKYKNDACDWILGAICSILGSNVKNKDLRQQFYQNLKRYGKIKTEGWMKNVPQVDRQEYINEANVINKPAPLRQQNLSAENNMSLLYSQFNMGEMDEAAMIKMAIQISNQQNLSFNNRIQEEKQNIQEEQMIMEDCLQMENKRQTKKNTFIMDLVQHCTKDLEQPLERAIAKIVSLYVISKHINASQDQLDFQYTLLRIKQIIFNLTLSYDNYDKHILMCYLSLFGNILSTSKILKQNSSKQASSLYSAIKQEVIERLQQIKPQKVIKLKTPPNLLGRIFRGQKIYTFAHYAYGLVNLILPPCQPRPVLLSLECYWLLPQSKQHYTKMKSLTTIKEGISTGNIQKIYEVSTKYPQIWRQTADVQWLQSWIQHKKDDWERALSLLALYYENNQTDQQQSNHKI